MNRRRAKDAVRTAAKGAFWAADVFSERMPGPRVLIYHQIEAGLGRQMEVTEANFGRQVNWMLDNGRIVDLEYAIDTKADDVFVLTFDDGYRDVFDRAWPMLRDHGIPFVIYLTTEPIESGRALTPGGRAEPLTWANIDEMLESGLMTLGAHTHAHRDLRLLEVSEIEAEIKDSNDLILARTGIAVRHFAYPWGYWSIDADTIVRSAYASAVLGSGTPVAGDTDPFQLNRIPVQLSDSMVFFTRKMTTGMRLEDRVRRRLVGYHGP
jgi:peptidoglycan/xylan/chitin deacetylase (PgdA/CDA1 family)